MLVGAVLKKSYPAVYPAETGLRGNILVQVFAVQPGQPVGNADGIVSQGVKTAGIFVENSVILPGKLSRQRPGHGRIKAFVDGGLVIQPASFPYGRSQKLYLRISRVIVGKHRYRRRQFGAVLRNDKRVKPDVAQAFAGCQFFQGILRLAVSVVCRRLQPAFQPRNPGMPPVVIGHLFDNLRKIGRTRRIKADYRNVNPVFLRRFNRSSGHRAAGAVIRKQQRKSFASLLYGIGHNPVNLFVNQQPEGINRRLQNFLCGGKSNNRNTTINRFVGNGLNLKAF